MPLAMADAGTHYTIQKITGKDEVRQHLAELGFVVGEPVRVVNELAGNLILVKIGQSAIIKKLHGEGAVKRRIMDMGLTKGTEVYVRKVAPLGDPLELTVRGYELSLRKEDAQWIEVE